MLNLKFTAAAVIFFSTNTFAGTMGPVCSPINVTVPCPTTAWSIGAQALYLQPSYNADFNFYNYDEDVGSVVNDSVFHYTNNDLNWGWGFKVETAFYFNIGNDINVNWYHFDKDFRYFTNFTSASFLDFEGLVTAKFNSNAALHTKWNAVNVEFGQHVDFGSSKDIRFHAGIQYAQIERRDAGDINFLGELLVPIDLPILFGSINSQNKFNGVGPRIGTDMTYNWRNGFSIYGNGAAALLIGTSKFSYNFVATDLVAEYMYPGFLKNTGSQTALVPELEGKLGAQYNYAMWQGNLTLDGGYMVTNYFNALNGTRVFNSTLKASNFVVQGPYFGLKWVGAL